MCVCVCRRGTQKEGDGWRHVERDKAGSEAGREKHKHTKKSSPQSACSLPKRCQAHLAHWGAGRVDAGAHTAHGAWRCGSSCGNWANCTTGTALSS